MVSSRLTAVKLAIYRTVAETTRVPTVADVARQLHAPVGTIQAAFEELHGQKLLVPEPGDPTRVRMAPPFSAIETPFRVTVGNKDYWANCVWDSLGVAAALHGDAVVHTTDGHTGEPMTLEVRGGAPVPVPCAIHFAVPMAHGGDDIIYS